MMGIDYAEQSRKWIEGLPIMGPPCLWAQEHGRWIRWLGLIGGIAGILAFVWAA